MHSESLSVSIHCKVLIIQSQDGQDLNMFNQITLPLQCGYLTTSYFRIFSSASEEITEEIEEFAKIAWEIM